MCYNIAMNQKELNKSSTFQKGIGPREKALVDASSLQRGVGSGYSAKALDKFLSQLAESFFLFAPQREDDILKIKEVENIEDIAWSTEMPINSWKDIFFAARGAAF